MKRYIIVATDKKTGEHFGYVEKQFDMGYDKNRVRVWSEEEWPSDCHVIRDERREAALKELQKYSGFEAAYKTQAYTKPNSTAQYIWFQFRFRIQELAKSHPEWTFKVYRVGSKGCPFKVDLKERYQMDKKIVKKERYDYLNCRFSLK